MEEMTSKIYWWWWTSNEKGHGWAMLMWDNLYLPKDMGGVGFRDLWLFNLALLGQQVWWLISQKDTLCFQVLSSKYFFDAKALDKGFSWHLGDDCSIRLDKDKWGFEGLDGNALQVLNNTFSEVQVRDIWFKYHGGWNMGRVRKLYGDSLTSRICDISILPHGLNDSMVWFHNIHDFYMTKSAYSWLLLKSIGFEPHRFFWKYIWKIKVLPKI
ncbi:hypothetical protein J1N35_038463 [Gossypium stocksii]|uniref:Reverse transcriptase zinc-binding domain-containing protein n=1 Tax=Gossypium stocksii TaxID=47602 RepID=A0A9D3UMS8_9ROSI|nr:hypothetical protein J1N35_038463 [Gossypium stocksii]